MPSAKAYTLVALAASAAYALPAPQKRSGSTTVFSGSPNDRPVIFPKHTGISPPLDCGCWTECYLLRLWDPGYTGTNCGQTCSTSHETLSLLIYLAIWLIIHSPAILVSR